MVYPNRIPFRISVMKIEFQKKMRAIMKSLKFANSKVEPKTE